MKTPIFSLLLALSIALPAHAGVPPMPLPDLPDPEPSFQLPLNGGCASADGDLRYSASQYQGGAAPFPGMLLTERVMEVEGSEWASERFFQPGGEQENDGSWPLLIELEDAQLVLQQGDFIQGRVLFTAKMTVHHLTADIGDETRYVICENSWVLAP